MGANNFTAIDDLMKNKDPGASGYHKESEPPGERFEIKEVVENKIEEEVKPYMSPRSETIELPPDIKKLGAQPVGQSNFQNYQTVKLPLSDEKIVVGLQAPITTSLRWLATFAVYLLAQAHLGLKVVHGKVVRVIKVE